jgi:hypothetical protein
VYHFKGHKIYVSIEETSQWVEVIYHEDEAQQRLLRLSRSHSLLYIPQEAQIEVLGDLDRDGHPDLWLSLNYGGDTWEDLLFMSRHVPPGKLLRQVVRTGIHVY